MNNIKNKITRLAEGVTVGLRPYAIKEPIKIADETRLERSIDAVLLKEQSDVMYDSSREFLGPRETRNERQAIVFSSTGPTVLEDITPLYTNVDFIFVFNNFPIPSDRLDVTEEQRNLLGLQRTEYRPAINSGWFFDPQKEEYVLAVVTKKPRNVFNRYAYYDPNPSDPNPDAIGDVKIVLDESTRAEFHYPLFYARELYSAVYAKYVTSDYGSLIAQNTEIQIPGQNTVKKFSENGMGNITLTNISQIYDSYLPEIIRQFPGGNAVDITHETGQNHLENVLNSMPIGEEDSEARTALQNRISKLESDLVEKKRDRDNTPKTSPTYGSRNRAVQAIELEIRNLRSQIDGGERRIAKNIPVDNIAAVNTTEKERKTLNAFLPQFNAMFSDRARGVKKLNYPAMLSKTVPQSWSAPLGPIKDPRQDPATGISVSIPGPINVSGSDLDPNKVIVPNLFKEVLNPKINVDYSNTDTIINKTDLSNSTKLYYKVIFDVRNIHGDIPLSSEEQQEIYEEEAGASSINQKIIGEINSLREKIVAVESVYEKYSMPITIQKPVEKVGNRPMPPMKLYDVLKQYLFNLKKNAPVTLDTLERKLSKPLTRDTVKKKDVSVMRIVLDGLE